MQVSILPPSTAPLPSTGFAHTGGNSTSAAAGDLGAFASLLDRESGGQRLPFASVCRADTDTGPESAAAGFPSGATDIVKIASTAGAATPAPAQASPVVEDTSPSICPPASPTEGEATDEPDNDSGDELTADGETGEEIVPDGPPAIFPELPTEPPRGLHLGCVRGHAGWHRHEPGSPWAIQPGLHWRDAATGDMDTGANACNGKAPGHAGAGCNPGSEIHEPATAGGIAATPARSNAAGWLPTVPGGGTFGLAENAGPAATAAPAVATKALPAMDPPKGASATGAAASVEATLHPLASEAKSPGIVIASRSTAVSASWAPAIPPGSQAAPSLAEQNAIFPGTENATRPTGADPRGQPERLPLRLAIRRADLGATATPPGASVVAEAAIQGESSAQAAEVGVETGSAESAQSGQVAVAAAKPLWRGALASRSEVGSPIPALGRVRPIDTAVVELPTPLPAEVAGGPATGAPVNVPAAVAPLRWALARATVSGAWVVEPARTIEANRPIPTVSLPSTPGEPAAVEMPTMAFARPVTVGSGLRLSEPIRLSVAPVPSVSTSTATATRVLAEQRASSTPDAAGFVASLPSSAVAKAVPAIPAAPPAVVPVPARGGPALATRATPAIPAVPAMQGTPNPAPVPPHNPVAPVPPLAPHLERAEGAAPPRALTRMAMQTATGSAETPAVPASHPMISNSRAAMVGALRATLSDTVHSMAPTIGMGAGEAANPETPAKGIESAVPAPTSEQTLVLPPLRSNGAAGSAAAARNSEVPAREGGARLAVAIASETTPPAVSVATLAGASERAAVVTNTPTLTADAPASPKKTERPAVAVETESGEPEAGSVTVRERPEPSGNVRENLAVRKTALRNPSVGAEAEARGRRFLTVESQEEGGGRKGIGTGIAPQIRTMPQLAIVPPAVETGREPSEASAALLQASGPRPTAPALADAGVPRSYAAAVVREVMAAAERLAPAARTHVELRLQTFDDENVRIHLQWRDGAIQARFVTESTELQQALSREWDTVAPRFGDKGLRFAEPAFERRGHEQSGQQQNPSSSFAFDQQRQPRGRHPDAEAPAFSVPAFLAAAREARPLPADLLAAAAQLQPAQDAGRGLRTWA